MRTYVRLESGELFLKLLDEFQLYRNIVELSDCGYLVRVQSSATVQSFL